MKVIKILALFGVLPVFSCVIAVENTELPGPGWYGFDWGNRGNLKNVQCVPMTERLLARFQSLDSWCDEVEKSGYGGKTDNYYGCRIGNASRYLVYADESTCNLALGVMRTFTKASAEEIAPHSLNWHGFDRRHLQGAECVPMTRELLTQFRPCTYRAAAAGRLGNPESYRCAVSKKVEYLVFPDKDTCDYERSGMLERFLLRLDGVSG